MRIRDSVSLGVAITVLVMTFGVTVQESSAEELEKASGQVRVVDRRNQLLPASRLPLPQADMDSQVRIVMTPGEVPLPSGEALSVGEVVQVNYSNGVAVHERVAATCTVSATAQSPFKAEGPNYSRAVARLSYSRSSGCKKGGAMAMLWGPHLFQGTSVLSSQYLVVVGGWTSSVQLLKNCKKGNKKLWRSQMGAPEIAGSSWVTLPCTP